MSDVNLTIKHGRTREEARTRLAGAVREVQNQFGSAIHRVDWSADQNSVHVSGTGFDVDAWVDDQEVHLVGEVPLLRGFLGGILGGAVTSSVKQIVYRAFDKQLPGC